MKWGVHMSFGAKLKELRIKNRMTQEELGKFLNVTKVSISGYENDTRSPDKESLVKLAELFNVSTDYLLGRATSQFMISEEIIKLDEPLRNTSHLTYNHVKVTEEDKQAIDNMIAGYYWNKEQRKREKENQ